MLSEMIIHRQVGTKVYFSWCGANYYKDLGEDFGFYVEHWRVGDSTTYYNDVSYYGVMINAPGDAGEFERVYSEYRYKSRKLKLERILL